MNAGYVYVLAFGNGTIKVGRTQNAPQRLSAHKSSARSFGITIADEWISPLHVEWQANEDALKEIAASAGGTPTSPEYFSGANFATVTEEARKLPFTPPEPGEGTAPQQAGGTPKSQVGLVKLTNPLSKLAALKQAEQTVGYLVEFAYLLYELGMDVEGARRMPMDFHCADALNLIYLAEENPEKFAAA